MLGRCRLAQAAVESLSPVLSWYWWPCRGSVSGTGGLAESLCLWYWWPCQSFPADAGGHPDPGGGWRRRLDYSDVLALRCYNQNTLHWPCVVTTRTRCTGLELLQPEHVALALRCYNQNTLRWPCVFPPKTRCTGLALLQPKHVCIKGEPTRRRKLLWKMERMCKHSIHLQVLCIYILSNCVQQKYSFLLRIGPLQSAAGLVRSFLFVSPMNDWLM